VLPLESVPNVSEGRDSDVVAAVGTSFATHARLLDVHSDVDHHRSVYTLVGTGGDEALVDSLVAGVAAAADRIDLARHDGAHPRVGAADVVPLVPLVADDMERAREAALAVGRRVGGELGLPVFLYGETGDGRRPAFFRRGGPGELQRRVDEAEITPDFGPSRLHARAGAVLVGARKPLVAFNIVLDSDDLAVARAVATAVRESGGGLAGVQALGVLLASSGRVQVSMNVVDLDRVSLHEVVARVEQESSARGAGIESAELVGLLPAGALIAAARTPLHLPALDASRVLELQLGEDPRAPRR
jgi:glutamate formiminotransferase